MAVRRMRPSPAAWAALDGVGSLACIFAGVFADIPLLTATGAGWAVVAVLQGRLAVRTRRAGRARR